MRAPMILAVLTAAAPVAAQEQQARAPVGQPPQQTGQQAGAPVYDMVAGDRETAWRINRITGEIVICRVDTTGSLEAARARCSPAAFDTAPQQSSVPAPLGGSRP